jgi:hypothetical protein
MTAPHDRYPQVIGYDDNDGPIYEPAGHHPAETDEEAAYYASLVEPAPAPSPEERRAEIRDMIAERGWTERVERKAALRFALAMVAEGLTPPAPEVMLAGAR